MTESQKTMIYVGVAVLLGLVAFTNRPEPPGVDPFEEVGQLLFPDFEDANAANSLEISQYDEELSRFEQFKVAQIDGRWSIPSHQNYPADASDHLRDAATLLIDLEVIDVASDLANDHADLGVIEPDQDKVESGAEGVGIAVEMQDAEGQKLAHLIIGKTFNEAKGLRFVRKPDLDRVYLAAIDPEKLTTKFADWIEDDLLEMSSWDIKKVELRDYSVQGGLRLDGRFAVSPPDQRLNARLSLDSSTWKLDNLQEQRGGELRTTSLLDDEELNKEKLDGLKQALDELKIVDVERKPKGLSESLRAEKESLEDAESFNSLVARGFYFVQMPGREESELWSSDGEVVVGTEAGIEYLLRFGDVAGMESSNSESGDTESDGSAEGAEDSDAMNLNRYLVVTARVWDENVPQPEPQPEAAAEAAPEAGPAAVAEGDQNEGPDDTEEGQESADSEADGGSEDDAEQEQSEADKEREEQQKKRDEAETKVRELNARFANWYYVISEDVYRKIHLGREDIIKAKEGTKDEGTGVDSFRKLQEEGLEAEQE